MLAAVLRAVWGLTGAFSRGSEADPSPANAWETSREEVAGVAAPRGVDLPPELSELATARAPSPPRLTVEIRPPASGLSEPSARYGPARPNAVDPAALRISQRVVLHLARLGRVGPEEVAPPGSTQRGMVAALGVRQSTLTKVLARLVAAGALEEERAHVQGEPRRLKVYRLTPLGEAVARDLRRPRPGATSGRAETPRPI